MSNPSTSRKKKSSHKMIQVNNITFQRKQYMSNVALAKWLKLISKRYRMASKVLQYVEEKHVTVLKAQYHLDIKLPKPMPQLVEMSVYHKEEIEFLLDKFDIVEHLNHINIFILKVLVAELLWGKQYLSPNRCTRILYYEADLLESFTEAAKTSNKLEDSTVPLLPVYVRINTLAAPLQECIDVFLSEGWKLSPKCKNYADYLKVVSNLRDNNFVRDFHISELLVFPSDTLFYGHPGHLSGKFFIQDKGSCLSSFLLNPKPGSRIIDMCAAPGIKTNHLANIINNDGSIFACDNHPDRFNALCKLLDSTGVTCVETIYEDCMKLNQSGINYILVDAPSTYSGIFYKREKKSYLDKRLERSFKISSMMLRYALQNFKGVKRVVYTSCSKFPEETDVVVEDALDEVRGAYSLLDAKEMLWNQWGAEVHSAEHPNRSKCLHIKPKADLCEGYFIAVFERNPEVPLPRYVHRKEELFYNDEDEERDDDDNDDDNDYDADNADDHNNDNYKMKDKTSDEYPRKSKSKSFAYKNSFSDHGIKYKNNSDPGIKQKNHVPDHEIKYKTSFPDPGIKYKNNVPDHGTKYKTSFPDPETKHKNNVPDHGIKYKTSYPGPGIKHKNNVPDHGIKYKTSFPDHGVKHKKSFPDQEVKYKTSFPDHGIKHKNNVPDHDIKYKTRFPDHGAKVYKPQYYKPYDKHFKNNEQSFTKTKSPKFRASSSVPHPQFNDYSDDYACEPTDSQLYP